MACVDLPAFPLQLLRRRMGSAAGSEKTAGADTIARFPTVVVEEDKPQARVLWVCERARAEGILPGNRYGEALSLCAELRAGVVAAAEIDLAVERFAQVLRALSPDVEPCRSEPGVFWLSGDGLRQIFPSASAWGRAILQAAREAGFSAGVAVGFSRFATYAVARGAPKLSVFRDANAERKAAHAVPLDRLSLGAELRDAVLRLGVDTLGGYLALPASGVLLRFGREAFRLHELAAGGRWDPLQAQHPEAPLEVRCELDDPEADATRLLFLLKRELHALLAKLAERKLALRALVVVLSYSRAFGEQRERLEPAEPTLDERLLLRLVQLRLESCPARAAVMGIGLVAETVPARASQVALFLQGPRRDLHAAGEALAQLRAELGEASVRKAVLRDGHLPEAQFSWEPLTKLPAAQPRTGLPRVLIRRIRSTPLPVEARGNVGNLRNDGWLISGLEHGSVLRFQGPYFASGGWWARPDAVRAEAERSEAVQPDAVPADVGEPDAVRADVERAEAVPGGVAGVVPPHKRSRAAAERQKKADPKKDDARRSKATQANAGAARVAHPAAVAALPKLLHDEYPKARDQAAQPAQLPDAPARDYGFADTRRGECLWLFYDRARRQWFIQGSVE
jgi:protein ImuB